MTDFMITSWDFSSGSARLNERGTQCITPDCWYHCQRDAIGLREWLSDNKVPEAITETLLTDDTRPRFEKYDDQCFLIIVRGINLNEGSEPDDMLSLRILWFHGALISTRKVPSRAVSTLNGKLEQGKGPTSLPALLLDLVNGINHVISELLSPIESQIDHLDMEHTSETKTLNSLYSRLLRIRRYLKPQRYVFEDLLHAEIPELAKQHNHLKNSLDTIARMNESIEFYIDQINLYLANVSQLQSEKMNRNTYLFSLIAGIFLPAGFLTGLLGVNIGGMPGTDNVWAFGYFCTALVVIILAEIAILKKLRFL